MITWLSGAGERKPSCFSAVIPVSGWNQWVKCVAPFATAQAHMASATALATERSSFLPLRMVSFRFLYTSADSVARMTLSSNTMLPNSSGTVFMEIPPSV